MAQALSTNTFTAATWIVNTDATKGTHTTLAGALTSASSGDTILLQSSVTENPTLKAGVNIVAWQPSSLNPTISITGKMSFSSAGSVSLSGIRCTTNSDNFLAITGSAASIVNFENCYLNASNATGITFSSSSSSAAINVNNSMGDLGTTGIGMFTHTSAGAMNFSTSRFTNSGGSSTQSTCASGVLNITRCTVSFPITTSSTAAGTCAYSLFDTNGQTPFAAGGSGIQGFRDCIFISGSAVGFTASSATPLLSGCTVASSNTNAISGSGTLNYTPINFISSSSTVNTSTQVPIAIGPKIYTNGGISFDAGTTLLNVYQTGTWTPNLQINGSSTGITYGGQVGGYTRIGNVVTIWCTILLTSKGVSVGSVTISNLPIATSTNGGQQALAINYFNGLGAASYTSLSLVLAASSTVGQFIVSAASGAGIVGITDANITNAFLVRFNGSYIIN